MRIGPMVARTEGGRPRAVATLSPVKAPSAGGAAIFVLPTTTVDQVGPVAGWLSTSGWAAAGAREVGQAWIVTPHGILSVDDVRRRAAASERPTVTAGAGRARRLVPSTLKTLVKDGREMRRARQFHIDPRGPWGADGSAVSFVWQRHELFHTAGLDLAQHLRAPSVLFVPALVVWQAQQWGVHRPGWAQWLERHAEAPALQRATLVACGTEVIAEQVTRLGVAEERVMVTPTGVDLSLFAARHDAASIRGSLGIELEIEEELVIGWAGSFRPFHALDQLVRATASVANARLLMVGDGPERSRIEELAQALGVRAHFTGLVAHDDLPRLLAAMDVAVVLGRVGEPFHYSPLKLAEYLAAGLAVVAPAVPQLTARLADDRDAVFFPLGDVEALSAALRALGSDPERRRRLAARAREVSVDWSWDHQVRRVLAALGSGGG